MKEVYEHLDCIICGSKEYSVFYKGKAQHDLPVSVCLCRKCGFSYLNPRWNEETYLDFYKYEYDNYYRNKPILADDLVDKSSYHLLLERYIKNYGDSNLKNILDIGSGDGKKLAYIKNRYPDANYFALESSSAYKTKIEDQGIFFISDNVNSDWELAHNKKFDLVIMRHTLEHFLDPYSILSKVKKVLSETGLVYIAVPDTYNPTRPLTKECFRVVHPYYYTKDSLANLLNKAGFSIDYLVEGDKLDRQELFLFAINTGSENSDILIANKWDMQNSILNKELKYENSFVSILMRLSSVIVKCKKMFFPNPIIKKKQKMEDLL